ncbi:MAG: carboxypeptidase regulatory-like domain-containing protein [bacterium]|nr:carboxypeptidase regulatory-like domain-containing protein [bacterium]
MPTVKRNSIYRFILLLITLAPLMLMNCGQHGESYEDINSDMGAISGQIINRITGAGLPDIKVEFAYVPKGYYHKTKTGWDGFFLIRNMPAGNYELDRYYIIRSCPKGLEAPATTKTFKIVPGKILKNVKIYLQRMTTISGYVYAADMVTPLENVKITTTSGYYNHYEETAYTDKRGRYHLSGFDSGQKMIDADKTGFANESLCMRVKSGKDYKNIHFILGKGSVSVKGKIVSDFDNQPIEGAELYFCARMVEERFSCGRLKTDHNGEYEMVGLKVPGPFKVSISHEKYYGIGTYQTIKLKPGLNVLDFKLIPRKNEEKNEKNAPGNNAKK